MWLPVPGAGLSVDVILILGFSSIFADAVSMGAGDAMSTKAENDYIMAEKKREEWCVAANPFTNRHPRAANARPGRCTCREFDNSPEGEIEEMVDLYVSKGMSREDAQVVIERMAKYRDFFVDVMMIEELELQVPGEDDNPWKDGTAAAKEGEGRGACVL